MIVVKVGTITGERLVGPFGRMVDVDTWIRDVGTDVTIISRIVVDDPGRMIQEMRQPDDRPGAYHRPPFRFDVYL